MSENMDYEVPSKRRSKPNKRYVQRSDDDDEPPVPAKAPRRTSSTRPRRRSTAADEPVDVDFDEPDVTIQEDVDVEMTIDVVGVDEEEDEEFLAAASVDTSHRSHSQPQGLRRTESQGKPSRSKTASGGKVHGDGPPARKKARKVVMSDEEEDDYLADEVVQEEEEPSDEEYYMEEDKPKRSKGKTADGRGTKRKAKGDPESSNSGSRPALERKLSTDTRKKGPPKTVSAASLKADESLHSLLDFSEGGGAPTPDASDKLGSPVPSRQGLDSPVPASQTPSQSQSTTSTVSVPAPALKKLKLPTIKKNKLPGAGTSTTSGANTGGTSTPTSATPKTKLPLDLGIPAKPGDNRKAHNATADLDLSNKSIYQELFKTSTDGGAPRTGLNRRTKEEERRKELNKLREDYLAKQAEEAGRSFDLQAPTDKILQFEEQLRDRKSAALYPQLLGAKWKQIYERELEKERKKLKELQDQTPVVGTDVAVASGELEPGEEGEVG